MRIITWNVNGLRAIWKKGDLQDMISKYDPDVLGIQETKSEEEQLHIETKNHKEYKSYFLSSTMRKGYSGVAVYTKKEPVSVTRTLQVKDFRDDEGRLVTLEYDKFFLMNCYFPNGGKSEEHFAYKLEFYKHFLNLAKKLEKTKPVIFMGDVNATVGDIDLARPKENAGHVGCTPEERAELKKFVESFVDVWRQENPEKQEYTWWDMKSRARDRNIGWRIDYIFISKSLQNKVRDIQIIGDQFGSDHCPVLIDIDL